MRVEVIGLAWFRTAEDYDALGKLMDDGDTFRCTYAEWLSKAGKGEYLLASQGKTVVRAYLDPVEFPKWCLDHGLKIDSEGRRRFAAAFAAGRVGLTANGKRSAGVF
jgi:hypothetical protein